ncbi:glycosyl transferases group 1-domain-containing protein [Neurospora hispaniola]|uniref:Chitobiosyldiphosphodolichol beta-mannosyltransferase n=1 Tax=Neurospora hispaniola TaxID=588809 RepID=A0AAJ0MMF6_9PEZI|nr:glycosyl transferases group 1-domain-containing protein [Neurospora hispaniola]
MASIPVALVIPLVLTGLALLVTYLVLGPSKYDGPSSGKGVVVHVLVLGDIGRSPRMTYHALSIAKHGGKVNLIGYLETPPHPSLLSSPSITIHALSPPPVRPARIPFLLFAPFKVLHQFFCLFALLSYTLPPSQWLLVQNPPSIPTLFIASLVCHLRSTKLLIDWHNYGWTILSSTRGPRHPLVYIAKLYECLFGRLGDHNLTVTHAMARQLRLPPYKIQGPITAVHDRPAEIFKPMWWGKARQDVLERVLPAEQRDLVPSIMEGNTKLIVSSTSWTRDEDFGILLDALVAYAADPVSKTTPVLAVITGKGPQKEMYLAQIAELTKSGQLPNVSIVTAFLPFEDYAKLLACADLGVCLHMSSSGVDLPMKVVDMFGAGLPVAAFCGYESFGELVKEGVNGRGFETYGELSIILRTLLSPEGSGELEVLRKGAVKEGARRWDEEWDAKVAKIMGFAA